MKKNEKIKNFNMSIQISQNELEIIKIVYGAVVDILGILFFWYYFLLFFYEKILLFFIFGLNLLNMKMPKKGFSLYEIGRNIFGKIYKNFNFYKRFYGTFGGFNDKNLENLINENELNSNIITMLEENKWIMENHLFYITKIQKEDEKIEIMYINFTSKNGKIFVNIFGKKEKMELFNINNNSNVTSDGIQIIAGKDLSKIISKEDINWKGNVNKEEVLKIYWKIIKEKGGILVHKENVNEFYDMKRLEKMNFFKLENYNEFVNDNIKNEKVENIIKKNINSKD